MALWCRSLPTVTVPKAETSKAVTLVYPYYENPQFLARQIELWSSFAWEADLARCFSVIVVDDGSPTHPASEVVPVLPSWLRLFRIEQDVRWNWLAARNIGMYHAAPGWCLLTDMDHMVPEATLRAIVHGQHDRSVIYAFQRQDVKPEGTTAIAPHSASFLLTRDLFWKVGGYDETLSGHYGTDGDWRRRCAAVAPMRILSTPLLRYEYFEDSSTSRYQRKQPEDAGVKALIAKRRKGWTPKTLSFPYAEVGQC